MIYVYLIYMGVCVYPVRIRIECVIGSQVSTLHLNKSIYRNGFRMILKRSWFIFGFFVAGEVSARFGITLLLWSQGTDLLHLTRTAVVQWPHPLPKYSVYCGVLRPWMGNSSKISIKVWRRWLTIHIYQFLTSDGYSVNLLHCGNLEEWVYIRVAVSIDSANGRQ